MANESIPTFYFYRTKEVAFHNGVKGTRGMLEAGGKRYFTIERDVIRYVDIPLGTYPLSMEMSKDDPTRKQFRIDNHFVSNDKGIHANLLIHVGSYPDVLLGCIGPGISMIPAGVSDSGKAMEELFKLCGGFQVRKNAAILEVVPQFTYDINKLKGSLIQGI